ncbi:MAG: YqgE/AlgH family protein [Thermodesulfobacteriota bacterium]
MDSLAGQFLIATPQMSDPRFQEAVILLCSHDETGAFGLIINQPLAGVTMGDVLPDFPLPDLDSPPVLFGGPVDPESAFFLHSSDYPVSNETGLVVSSAIFLSRSPNLLLDVGAGQGPEHFLFILGYAGWGPGQLEEELVGEGWLPLPATAEDVFLTSAEQLWRRVAAKFGIDISLFSDLAGNA